MTAPINGTQARIPSRPIPTTDEPSQGTGYRPDVLSGDQDPVVGEAAADQITLSLEAQQAQAASTPGGVDPPEPDDPPPGFTAQNTGTLIDYQA